MNKEESLPNGEGFFLIICHLYYTMMIGGDDVDGIEIFKRWIDESIRIVAFTGAGVSTESGIKDFRSADGLYNEKWRPNCDNTTEFVS